MAIPPLSDEDAKAAVQALQDSENKTQAAKKIGIPRATLQHRLRVAAQRGLDGNVPKPMPPGQIVKSTSTLFRLDPETGAEELLQWVKTKEDPNFEAVFECIKDAFDTYKDYSVLPPPPTHVNSDLLALYPLADFHLGMYAWGEEAGIDWDVDKACAVLRDTMSSLISETEPADVAVVLNLGDFYHADSSENRTMRSGHALDVDTRYARVLSFGVELMVEVVQLALQRHGKVIIRNLRGNHDDHSSVALSAAMGAFFSNDGRVTVDASPSAYWLYRHGRTYLGATHGDTIKKPEIMQQLMSNVSPVDWGRTRHRYFHSGHIHHASSKEIGGVLCESHRTLAPKDAWAAAAGYQSGRAMSSIVYHKKHGEVARLVRNIPHWKDT